MNDKTETMENLNLDDIQGLIKRGYDTMPYSNILFFQIEDKQKTKKWLGSLLPSLSRGSVKKDDLEIDIAFSYEGFKAIGLVSLLQNGFSLEFTEGMSEENRSRLLGDYDNVTNLPKTNEWEWRDGAGGNAVHLMLLIYGKEEHLVEKFCSELKLCNDLNGLRDLNRLVTVRLDDSREHFGFRDGISQPFIKEFVSREENGKERNEKNNTAALGEFVLGYPNAYGQFTESPTVMDSKTGKEWDFGKNGTYLVMRQLEQDVKNFWEYMKKHTENGDGSANMDACIALASGMVGRRPNGTPLTLFTNKEDCSLEKENDFLFTLDKEKNYGKCPVGSHIVRVNPRDALAKDAAESLEVVSHHRLLRRGRSYGRPFITSMKPEELFSKANQEEQERGLHFICLNANISRQFEFVQSMWLNNSKFRGLYNDADQLSGANISDFTVQQRPVSRVLKDVDAFVKVRGGGYFFLPSHTALKFLTEI